MVATLSCFPCAMLTTVLDYTAPPELMIDDFVSKLHSLMQDVGKGLEITYTPQYHNTLTDVGNKKPMFAMEMTIGWFAGFDEDDKYPRSSHPDADSEFSLAQPRTYHTNYSEKFPSIKEAKQGTAKAFLLDILGFNKLNELLLSTDVCCARCRHRVISRHYLGLHGDGLCFLSANDDVGTL